MSDSLHCEIHEMLESHLQTELADFYGSGRPGCRNHSAWPLSKRHILPHDRPAPPRQPLASLPSAVDGHLD
jgi:hypothetical protein